ncbi:MAG: DUF4345 family protein [Pseudomonadota bacterium]
MLLQPIVIYLSAGFFLLYGLAFSFFPIAMTNLITQGELLGASAQVDFRATYGGMTLAVGLTILFLYRIGQARASLVVVILVLLAMAVTRTIGFVLEGSTNTLMYVYLILELAGSGLAFLALKTGPES